ncbi:MULTISPECIES: DUF4396 domain-containing protein [Bacillus]|uniref:DUF4396 domain-containing protein n=1 Tax=Bacillus TaxID=1386 RepID=UPI000417FFF2|nr:MULTISPECIES: DUF4396 domain-containing protein [Bacillus]QHZ48808.1 DUF4396 domain-containing protein [Bacillus sp. NSP9.1]WFA05550.1 DUF4396 domain-containing protein [Bacillus sp. HSf4]
MAVLEMFSYIGIAIGLVQAAVITIDVIRRPQHLPIMNVVWPVTGLYFPIIGFWAYDSLGRQTEQAGNDHKPFWQSVFISTTHCTSGCSLGDLIGAPLVYLLGWTVLGSMLFAEFAVEFILAFILGIVFQYYGMGAHGKSRLSAALKADTWSLIAFEIGMFGWMALVHFVFFAESPKPDSPVFWLMMQIAMIIGFFTSYPANWYLVKKGIKHVM